MCVLCVIHDVMLYGMLFVLFCVCVRVVVVCVCVIVCDMLYDVVCFCVSVSGCVVLLKKCL